ncbi:phage tail-collar fiber domain-containing protein [Acidaminococcus sp.]|uniref:phage tail-collar fiber domain-containing protein n=1 Tax=Acidaminococcus sp. TaxID=1872103 RepID=UPI003D7D2F78
MANWTGAILTNKGRTLEAKVTAGKCKLELTKLKVGDGTPSDIESMTDLVSPKANIGISSITPFDTGVCEVEGVITNANLEKGFYMRELGVFATDPDDGEILYAVMTDSHADYLQAKGSSTVLSVGLHLQVIITSADDVTAVLDPKGLLLRQDLDNHDNSEKAHPSLLQVTPTADKPASMSSRGLWVEILEV